MLVEVLVRVEYLGLAGAIGGPRLDDAGGAVGMDHLRLLGLPMLVHILDVTIEPLADLSILPGFWFCLMIVTI